MSTGLIHMKKGETGETAGWQHEVGLGSLNREPSVPDGMFNRQNTGAETNTRQRDKRGLVRYVGPSHFISSPPC